MKPWVVSACVLGVWLSQPATPNTIYRSADMKEWLDAAAEHQPGVEDAALRRIAQWSGGKLVRTLGTAREYKPPTEELNALLERAAVLHGDITLLRKESNPPWTDTDVGAGDSIFVKDGQRLSRRSLDPHLFLARMIFAAMREPILRAPSSGPVLPWKEAHRRNPRIHQWYRTISTELAARRWLADLRPHLEDARRVLDDTAETMFDSACFSEVITSAQIQRAVAVPNLLKTRAGQVNAGADPLLFNESFHLSEAERFYREAVKLDPKYTEARVRLARVLSLRNRHAEALALLQPEPPETPEAVVRYYAMLVLGQAADAAQKRDLARQAYAQASTLFPRAQSPLLALMRLARETGDDAAAKEAAATFASLGAVESYRLDPWWDYFDCNGRNRKQELEKLWSLYRTKDRQ